MVRKLAIVNQARAAKRAFWLARANRGVGASGLAAAGAGARLELDAQGLVHGDEHLPLHRARGRERQKSTKKIKRGGRPRLGGVR